MRKFPFFAIVFLVASCAQPQSDDSFSSPTESMDAAEEYAEPVSNARGIDISAAPGVAFNYRYAFRLPNNRIAAVQEKHAQACEQLGLDRCRITGLRYRLRDEDSVEAMLAFKLDPSIARQFGKDGIASVGEAEGMLVDSEISGIDAGAKIGASQQRSIELRAELADIETRLQRGGITNAERVELQRQAEAIRARLRGESRERAANEESLATTPMVFHYGSGSLIPGFDGSSPLRDAWRTAVRSFVTMVGFIIMTIGVLLPWLVLLALLAVLWRSPPMRAIRQWFATYNPQKKSDYEPVNTD